MKKNILSLNGGETLALDDSLYNIINILVENGLEFIVYHFDADEKIDVDIIKKPMIAYDYKTRMLKMADYKKADTKGVYILDRELKLYFNSEMPKQTLSLLSNESSRVLHIYTPVSFTEALSYYSNIFKNKFSEESQKRNNVAGKILNFYLNGIIIL